MTKLTEEQREFAATMRGLLADVAPIGRAREVVGGAAPDPAAWRRVAATGLLGVHLPPPYGGPGAGLLELLLGMRELGRVLFCGPQLASILAVTAVVNLADESTRSSVLPDLIAGEHPVGLATGDPAGNLDLHRVAATYRGDDHRVTGTSPLTLNATGVERFLIVADGAAGRRVLLTGGGGQGVEVTPLSTVDRTRSLSRVEFIDAPAQVVSTADIAPGAVERVGATAALCLAAESLGGAEQCLAMSLSYVRTRRAFGRPIGSFQALQHTLVEHYVAIEQARMLTFAAAASGAPPGMAAAAAAKAAATEAYRQIAFETILVHGGIGFTWEHDAHLYLRRAQADAQLFGSVGQNRRLAADEMFGPVGSGAAG